MADERSRRAAWVWIVGVLAGLALLGGGLLAAGVVFLVLRRGRAPAAPTASGLDDAERLEPSDDVEDLRGPGLLDARTSRGSPPSRGGRGRR